MDIKTVKFICFVIAPLSLVGIELFHPSGYANEVYHNLIHVADWWIILHVTQPLFFSLTGLGGIIMTRGDHSLFGIVSQISFFFFIVYYTVYDSVAGIGTGVLIDVVRNSPPEKQQAGIELIQKYFQHPYLGGSHTWLSEFASMAWLVAILSLIVVLFRQKKPYIPLLFFLLSGGLIWYNHGFPTGPMGFGCFFIGAAWIEYASGSDKPQC